VRSAIPRPVSAGVASASSRYTPALVEVLGVHAPALARAYAGQAGAANDDKENEMTATTARTPARSTPILFSRQRQLLQLLDALGGTAGMLGFQKLLFLYCQEASTGEAPYDFEPPPLSWTLGLC
jgi:hypothetical protein